MAIRPATRRSRALRTLLKRGCRPGDLVARYGGEEFVVLCADCRNATAAMRRRPIAEESGPTASAGLGRNSDHGQLWRDRSSAWRHSRDDAPAAPIARCSRRNNAGRTWWCSSGRGSASTTNRPKVFPGSGGRASTALLVQKRLVTTVPLKMAVEKIRGFVADHHAEIESIEGQLITLKISAGWSGFLKRKSDRPAAFIIELRLTEERPEADAEAAKETRLLRTQVQLTHPPATCPGSTADRSVGQCAAIGQQR